MCGEGRGGRRKAGREARGVTVEVRVEGWAEGRGGWPGGLGGGAFMPPYALARSLMPALTPAGVIADSKGGRSLTTCPESGSLMRRSGSEGSQNQGQGRGRGQVGWSCLELGLGWGLE